MALQVDLTPLRNHIDRALGEGYQEARICPALDELYSLLGRPVDEAMDQSISRMMASIPGATLSSSMPLLSQGIALSFNEGTKWGGHGCSLRI